MIEHSCYCGKTKKRTGLALDPCIGCPHCGTALAKAGHAHDVPRPHEWQVYEVDTDEGAKTLTRCIFCGITKRQWQAERAITE